MTQGPIFGKVLLFAIPIVISDILQKLYTTVDTLVVGNFCGPTALAAVGTSAQPVEVMLCLFLGVGVGASIIVSQCIGANDTARMNTVIRTSVFFVFVSGIPLTALSYFAVPYFLRIMGVPADTYQMSLVYTRIVLLGTLANIGFNTNAGILRGMGDSKSSLLFLVISCIVNIILDLVFVGLLGMGVYGVSVATTVSQFVSWISSIVYIRKRFPEIPFTVLPNGFDASELKRIIWLGIPLGFNSALFSFGHMAVQTLVNAQGSTFMAGWSTGQSVSSIANIGIASMANASVAFSGQNYGAGNIERLRKGVVYIPALSAGITFVMAILIMVARMPILRLFSRDEAVLMYASRYLLIDMGFTWCYAVYENIRKFINGIGEIKYPTIVSFLMLWAVRVPCAYVISKFFDGTYIMIGYTVSFVFAMVCMLGYCAFSKRWKSFIRGERQTY